jgi:hypothetical protein
MVFDKGRFPERTLMTPPFFFTNPWQRGLVFIILATSSFGISLRDNSKKLMSFN